MMKKKSIEFIRMTTLRGPNIWAYRPVIEAWVDIGDLEDYPSNTLPGFNARLSQWLPTLVEHRCSVGERGGFLQRLEQGTWPAHILEHVTLELQSLAGMPGGLGRARETSQRGVYKVIVRAWHETVTQEALLAARDLVMAAIEDRPFDVSAAVRHLRDLADDLHLGPSTACIVDAADDRDIPAIRLSEANLVQLGYGAQQRRIWTAETDHTSAIAEGIARDKDLTRRLLQACGVPVPEGRLVDSREAAWEAAQSIGLPVVVKPCDGNHGRGVFINLSSQEEVDTAFAIAVEEGSGVIVERFIPGNEHRLLVVGRRMVAAARGEIADVVGDGVSTVRELIALQLNADPRRGSDEDHPLNVIRLDSAAMLELTRQQLAPDDVPALGRTVLIQRNGNVAIDVTDQVHPEVAEAVTLAARIVGLDVAGVDLVAQDISRPLQEQGGAIVEVNAGPGLLMHLKPAQGQARAVGQDIIEYLFPEGETGYIPIVGVCGSTGKTATAQLIAHLLQLRGLNTGLACSEGLSVARRILQDGDATHWEAGRRLLLNRAVQAAVIETSFEGILGDGLPYERCTVGVVTDLDIGQPLPAFDMWDAEQLRRVVRTQIDVVIPSGAAVLNADDELVAGLAELSDGEVLYFGLDEQSPVLTEHLAQGRRAVFVRDGNIVLAQASDAILLTSLALVPLLGPDAVPAQIRHVLAAVAVAWWQGLELDLIRVGIETFGLQPLEAAVPASSV